MLLVGATGPCAVSATPVAGSFSFLNPTGTTVESFGYNSNSAYATYGQTFIAPRTTTITSIAFTVNLPPGTINNLFVLKAYIFTWSDPLVQPTGLALYTSETTSIPSNPATLTFQVPCIAVTVGQKYVAFLSTSGLWNGGDALEGTFGNVAPTSIPTGEFVFINSGNNPALWTTTPWSFTSNYDLACAVTYDV